MLFFDSTDFATLFGGGIDSDIALRGDGLFVAFSPETFFDSFGALFDFRELFFLEGALGGDLGGGRLFTAFYFVKALV